MPYGPPIVWHILGAYFLQIWGVGVVRIIFTLDLSRLPMLVKFFQRGVAVAKDEFQREPNGTQLMVRAGNCWQVFAVFFRYLSFVARTIPSLGSAFFKNQLFAVFGWLFCFYRFILRVPLSCKRLCTSCREWFKPH